MPGESNDPIAFIVDAFEAARRGECSWEHAARVAASADATCAAPPESVARLGEAFASLGTDASRLAEWIEGHAGAVADLQRGPEALALDDAILPVFERYAQPRQLGIYWVNRAHRLATCNNQEKALAAYDEAVRLLQVHGSPDAYAFALMYRANVQERLDRLDEAVASRNAALPLLRQFGPADNYTYCLMNQASLLIHLGRLDEAEACHGALSLPGQHVPAGDFARYFLNRARALESRDRKIEATTAYSDALLLLRRFSSAEAVALCLADRARLFLERWQCAEAIADYDEALPFFRDHGEPGAHAVCLLKRASALMWEKRLYEALADCDHALRLLREQGPAEELAPCLKQRAAVLERLGKRDEAVADYSAAVALFQKNADVVSSARCLIDRADVLEKQGDLTAALADYDEALRRLRETGWTSLYQWHLRNRISLLDKLGRIDDAEAAFDDYLAHGENEPGNHADVLIARARELHELGYLAEAVARYSAAAPLLEAAARLPPEPADGQRLVPERSPRVRYADCLVNRALALRALGLLAEAVASYDTALPVYEKEAARTRTVATDDGQALSNHSPLADLAKLHVARAMALNELGKREEAVAGFDAALPILRELDRLEALAIDGEEDLSTREILQKHARMGSALCLLNRAAVLVALGKGVEAEANFDEALPLFRRKQDLHGYALCLVGRGNALQIQGRLGEALAEHDEALRLLRQHASPVECARALQDRASVLRLLCKPAEALAAYDEALSVLLDKGSPSDRVQVLFNRAAVLIDLARWAEAVACFRDVRAILRHARRLGRIDDSSLEFTRKWAHIYAASVWTALNAGDGEQAYDAVCDGKAGLIGDLRHRLSPTAAEPAEVRNARAALTDWMRNHVPRARPGSHLAEAGHEQFLEELQQFVAERDQRTRSYLAAWGQHYHGYDPRREAAVDEAPIDRDRIQQCLPGDWALLDFWATGEEEFTVFVLFRDAFHIQKLPFPLAEWEPALDRWFQALADPRPDGSDHEVLSDLHRSLFAPLLPLLRSRGTSGLYLVPHDFLVALPLHAARSADTGSYLCEEFAVAYLPSASLLPRLPKPDATGPAFILANPEFGTEHSLPFAHWEGRQLAQRLGLTPEQVFLGANGTVAATEAWAGAGFVHFSCHGSGDPQFAPRSHLRLADDLLLAHDVLYRRQPLREGAVVILNGCQTGMPDIRAVNEGLGLMTAFLVRGAGLVLATQWSVEDACAAEMVLHFVEKLRLEGVSPAQALKQSQQHVRQMTISEILEKGAQVEEALAAEPRDLARMKANRAWTCFRAGLLDEATRAAAVAIPALRRSGMPALANRLLEDTQRARGLGVLPPQPCLYDNPLSWGAFQLIGRVT